MTIVLTFVSFIPAALTLTAYATTDQHKMRMVGILSNCAFLTYGGLLALPPVLGLHALLLVINTIRLVQIRRARTHAVIGAAGNSLPLSYGIPR